MSQVACVTTQAWSRDFPSSSNADWTYSTTWGPTEDNAGIYSYKCNCIGFSTRKKCKHVTRCKTEDEKLMQQRAAGFRCGWVGDVSETDSGRCPNCGEETVLHEKSAEAV